MPQHTQDNDRAFDRIRNAIGVAGLALPLLLLLGVAVDASEMQRSISAFFFTPMRDFFVAALAGTGVFLILYKGHSKEQGEWLSDNLVTNSAGIGALGTALIPTLCADACYFPVSALDQWFADDTLQRRIHFACAALFLIASMIMCISMFTRSSEQTPNLGKARRNRLYQICASIMLIMLVLLGLHAWRLDALPWPHTFVFWSETIAVWAFGLAWLVKGEALKRVWPALYRVSLRA